MIRNILASLLLLIPLVSVSIAGQSRPFNPDSDVNYISKHATLDKSAATIKFKSERDGWNHMAYLFKGSFKPNSTYTVFFNYRNPDVPDQNAILQFYARNTASEIPQADYASKDLPLRNNWTRGFISFFTDANADKYALGISSKYPMSCEIKDIVLKNGSPEDFVPIKSESPIEVDRNSLPTGAKEFEVEMPRPEKELIVNASEFGLDESAENCATIINAALEHCKKIGASKLVLPKGRYKIFEETPIKINGMKDFEFDGGGSTFVYRKRYSGNMAISYCVRTRIRNFNMDWDWETDPLASLVRVVKVVPGEYVDFEFYQYKNFPNRNVRVSNISSYDRKAKSVGIENGATISYEMKRGLHTPPKTEWLNGNTLRVFSVPNKTPLEAGQYYRMQHNYYEMGGIAMNSNKHLRMEDINIYSCCGQATHVRGTQQYWLFKNVNIAPPKGKSRRPISATADHCMIETSAGYFKMIDCDMGFGADDCINMHDNSLFTTKASANSVRTKSARNSYLYNKGEIFEFREDDYSPTGFTAKVADVKVVDKENGVNEIFFDKEIPNPQNSGFILFNWRYNTSNVIVRNCYFHQNRARGILIIARDVTIENCRFYRNEMGAIKIETGYTFKSWSEGLGVNNVVVRNCSFDTCNPLGVRNENFERDIFMGVYMRTDPSPIRTNFPIIENVLFENNKFKDTFGLVAFISSCHNVTFLNNTFENTKERKTPRPYRGSFYLSHTNNVKIINNKFMLSDFAPNPGIFTDKDSVKNTVVAGNEIVEKKIK
mgnify:FL=1